MERNPPLVSVIESNFNYAPFLSAAVDSALEQTHTPIEVVVVDDGSTDASRSLIESYGARITPVFKQNGGMASALNAGFRASAGDIVIFLDSDDVLLPTAAAAAVELLRDWKGAKVHWHLRETCASEQNGSFRSCWPGRRSVCGRTRGLVSRYHSGRD